MGASEEKFDSVYRGMSDIYNSAIKLLYKYYKMLEVQPENDLLYSFLCDLADQITAEIGVHARFTGGYGLGTTDEIDDAELGVMSHIREVQGLMEQAYQMHKEAKQIIPDPPKYL